MPTQVTLTNHTGSTLSIISNLAPITSHAADITSLLATHYSLRCTYTYIYPPHITCTYHTPRMCHTVWAPHLSAYTHTHHWNPCTNCTLFPIPPPVRTQFAMEAIVCWLQQVEKYSAVVEDLVYYNTSSCYPLWEAYSTTYTASCVNLLGSLVSHARCPYSGTGTGREVV